MALATEQQFHDTLKRSNHVLLTFRKDWSIDAAASALALKHHLERQGKRADIVAAGFAPTKAVNFLPGVADVRPAFDQLQKFIITLDVSQMPVDEISYDHADGQLKIFVTPKSGQYRSQDVTTAASEFKYDLIITLDTPDYASLGDLFAANSDFFYHRPLINLDHDPANERFGNVNCVDITATSTAEVVYSLLRADHDHCLTDDIATCLLTGLIAKTRSFKTPSVTPRTLEIASELMAAGARRDEIVHHLYRTRSLATLKLWGRALARLKYDPVAKFAWTLLVRQDFIHAGAQDDCLPDVIEELIANSPEAEIAGVLYEQEAAGEPGRAAGICALISSTKHADAGALMAGLKPEGTRHLARVCFPATSLIDAEKAVLNCVYKTIGQPQVAAALPAAGAPAGAVETPAAGAAHS